MTPSLKKMMLNLVEICEKSTNLFSVFTSFISIQKKISPLQVDRPGSRSSCFGFRAAPAEKKKYFKIQLSKIPCGFQKGFFSYAHLFIVFPTNSIFVNPIRLDAKLAPKSSLVVWERKKDIINNAMIVIL